MRAAASPRRVLLLNGVVVHGDAISRSLTLKREALLEAYDDRVQVEIATYASDLGLPGTHVTGGLMDLLALPQFRSADMLIYEFGVFYDLFDSVRFAPSSTLRLAVWHNITPPPLAASLEGAKLLRRSLDQRSNLLECDHVFCDSSFNAAELDFLNPSPGQISVLPLPVSAAFATVGATIRPGDPRKIRLLFVGRVVPAKGVLDLIRAFVAATTAVPDVQAELILIGNTAFSDAGYVGRVREASAGRPIRFLGQVDETALVEAYRSADVFVIPSYHEGYCVPVLEAYASGCHVIAYDAGNLPAIVGEHGWLVATGDVAGLQKALTILFRERVAAANEGREPVVETLGGNIAEFARRQVVRRYASTYTEGIYRETFIAGLERIAFTQNAMA